MTAQNLGLRIGLKRRKSLWGYVFVSPFVVGFVLFFLYPFVQSIQFSLSQVQITDRGFDLAYVGLSNYRRIFLVDVQFTREFTNSIISTITRTPAILIFSFFAANLLNQKSRGRDIGRMMFFLPVILGAEVVKRTEITDYFFNMTLGAGETGQGVGMLSSVAIRSLLLEMKLPTWFTSYILQAIDRIPAIINSSAIPILIFLAGLQSIPSSLMEAAEIEGATAWESFWKITFPMVSPLILTNVVFIVVDSFTSVDNSLVQLIRDSAGKSSGYGVTCAMAWAYFASVCVILAVVYRLVAKNVFYNS
jgi:ABC-type sugar transport system permease subunit